MNAGLYWHGLSIKTWFTATSTRRGACLLWWHNFLPEIRKTPLGSHDMSTAGWSTIECTLVKGFHAFKNELASFSINLRWSNMTTIWKSKALKNNTLEFLIITPDWNTCFFSGQTSQMSLFFAGSPRWLVDVWNHQDIRTAHPFLCGQGVPMTRALLRRLEGPSFVNACQELLNTWGILDVTWHNYKYRWLEVYAFHSCSISHCTKSSWILIIVI